MPAQRPNRVIFDLPQYLREDLDTLAEMNQTNRSALLVRAVSELLERQKADCGTCGEYTWINGYAAGKPQCPRCM